MSSAVTDLPAKKKHAPYVPETMEMKEFTFRAVLIGLVMTAILGSANAYLGLKAGMTIAATYPAAVIGMALLRLMKGSLLEENIARTVGSIGESVAAGAVFTIPAFVMAGLVARPDPAHQPEYWKSVALMMIGGTLGILFVTLLRRVMVEDPDLPFPGVGGRVRNSQGRTAGIQGGQDPVRQHGLRRPDVPAGRDQRVLANNTFPVTIGDVGKKLLLRTSTNPERRHDHDRRRNLFTAPDVSPAYLGVGYIIGPRLARSELCRRRAGLGTAGSAPDLHRSVRTSRPRSRPVSRSRGRCWRAPSTSRSCVPSRWAACWWALPTPCSRCASSLALGMGARRLRPEEIGRRARRHQPHRTRPERQSCFRGRRRRVRRHDCCCTTSSSRVPANLAGSRCCRGRGGRRR